jgi:hypothetical protein
VQLCALSSAKVLLSTAATLENKALLLLLLLLLLGIIRPWLLSI